MKRHTMQPAFLAYDVVDNVVTNSVETLPVPIDGECDRCTPFDLAINSVAQELLLRRINLSDIPVIPRL